MKMRVRMKRTCSYHCQCLGQMSHWCLLLLLLVFKALESEDGELTGVPFLTPETEAGTTALTVKLGRARLTTRARFQSP